MAASGANHPVSVTGAKSVWIFFAILVASGVVMASVGALLRGVDFANAVLLGFVIVAINFLWTKKAVKSVILDKRPNALLIASFVVKFALTAFILYYAIRILQFDPMGVLVGLSALLAASLLFGLHVAVRKAP